MPLGETGVATGARSRRLFVATPVVAHQEFLHTEMQRLVQRSNGVLRSIPVRSEHLTHAFLGACTSTVGELLEALAPITDLAPVPTRWGAARVFTVRGRPRLVCLDAVENIEKVVALSEAIVEALRPALPRLVDYRLKRPHVTLGRFNRRARSADAARLKALLAASRLSDWSGTETLSRVDLIESDLDHRGARYTTLGSVTLGRGP